MSSVLAGEPPLRADAGPTPGTTVGAAPPGPPPPHDPFVGGAPQRGNSLTVLAGVGVLLLAMGVGVLIGRSSAPKSSPAPAPVQTIIASAPASTTPTSSAPAEATFTGDWPSGTSGYTVQLQKLAQAGTSASAVEAAKTSASAKGAKAVGALKSEEFTSLTAGSYVIYSGVYNSKAQAEKALAGLKQSFPSAAVIHVANGTSGSASQGAGPSGSSSTSGGVGQSPSHPAPPTVLKGIEKSKGKSYEEKSKNLPNVVETG
jgi:SPOR domain